MNTFFGWSEDLREIRIKIHIVEVSSVARENLQWNQNTRHIFFFNRNHSFSFSFLLLVVHCRYFNHR